MDFMLGLPFYSLKTYLQILINNHTTIPQSLPCATSAELASGTPASSELSESQDYRSLAGVAGNTSYDLPDARSSGTPAFVDLFANLKLVVPTSIGENKWSGPLSMLAKTNIFTSSLHRQILFSVANNFAGLGASPVRDVIRFLQNETDEKFYQLFHCPPGPLSQAIAQNILKGAIEVGKAGIVDFLLTQSFAKIDINTQFCLIEGKKRTLIERASMLWHKRVIEILLKHGANVNQTYMDSNRKQTGTDLTYMNFNRAGALECAAVGVSGCGAKESRAKGSRVYSQIIKILLEAGGDISESFFHHEMYRTDGELIALVVAANASKNITKWSKWCILHKVIEELDCQTSTGIVKILLDAGVDIHRCKKQNSADLLLNHPNTAVDVAARRGNFEVVRMLATSGAYVTYNTIRCAVEGGNERLVQFSLENYKTTNDSNLQETTLDLFLVAVKSQHAPIIDVFQRRGALDCLNTKRYCSSRSSTKTETYFSEVLCAASSAGNTTLIEELIDRANEVDESERGCALTPAVRIGYDEFATKLIQAGAHTCFDLQAPLMEALERRNAALVHILLDADAFPNSVRYSSSKFMATAVEWGDHSVISELILAGASVNHGSLVIAVRHRDIDLAQLLLNAGAPINKVAGRSIYDLEEAVEDSRLADRTALAAAVANGDLKMTNYLLDRGADPYDPLAFKIALERSKSVFDMLTKRCNARYPFGRIGFCSNVLSMAVRMGNRALVEDLIGKGADPDMLAHEGSSTSPLTSPFGFAIISQQESIAECVELFLKNGCKPESIVFQVGLDQSPRITAFLAAVGTGNPATVKLFINYEADINFATFGPIKRTPLQRAAEIGSVDVIQLLIRHGANVNAPAARCGGGTALQLAASGGYIPAILELLNFNADVNAPASKVNGRTALDGAAEHGRLDTVQVLLNAGAGRGSDGQLDFTNAIALARDNGHFYICDHLEAVLRENNRGMKLAMNVGEHTSDASAINPFESQFAQLEQGSGLETDGNGFGPVDGYLEDHQTQQEQNDKPGMNVDSAGPVSDYFEYNLPQQEQGSDPGSALDITEHMAWDPDWDNQFP